MQTKAKNPLFVVAVVLLLRLGAPCACGQVTFTTLFSFNGTNGASPVSLMQGTDGDFYGTTSGAYYYGMGTVFKVTTNGTLTTLVSFNFTNGQGPRSLVQGTDGSFYGTTVGGGITNSVYYNGMAGMGTVFKVTTNGTLTALVSFNFTNGAAPCGGPVQGTDGNFYGTTTEGGITNSALGSGMGTVFQLTTNGTLSTLLYFNGTNGVNPSIGGLVQGTDGNFYGTTMGSYTGETYGGGTIFRTTPNGILTTLFTFESGLVCRYGLVQGADGDFYGASSAASSDLADTVFRISTNGAFATLYHFNGTNGSLPRRLVQGTDGNFYGVTGLGGTGYNGSGSGNGTIFRITPDGTLTTLLYFNGTNGSYPFGGLAQSKDGYFYGTTMQGGAGYDGTYWSGYGTIFRFSCQPIIAVQPQNQTNSVGARVTFSVVATNLSPMGYQWQKNGINLGNGGNISGASTDTLTIASISDSDAASYSVIVSNSFGSTTSSNAVLTVSDFLFIAAQPQSQTVGVGSNVTFNVTVYGAPPFVFQWYFNETPLGSPVPGKQAPNQGIGRGG